MISYSAAGYWIDAISGITSQTDEPGECFPAVDEGRSAARRNHLRSAWTAIVCAPQSVTRQAARIMPASLKAALAARADTRVLARNFKRLEGLGPHLLKDIGIEHVAAGVYEVIETGKPVAQAQPAEPAVIPTEAALAARPVNAAPQRARRASTGWPRTELAGAALP